jgi:hypothetical protein
MPDPAEPLTCQRCHRPVHISREQYQTFEQMHYVCFHYEFEHDPTDPRRRMRCRRLPLRGDQPPA